jgi:hypothetical protein
VASIAFSLLTTSGRGAPSPTVANVIGGFVFALMCGAMSFALLALFVRLVSRRNPIFDSLSNDEYGKSAELTGMRGVHGLQAPVYFGPRFSHGAG